MRDKYAASLKAEKLGKTLWHQKWFKLNNLFS